MIRQINSEPFKKCNKIISRIKCRVVSSSKALVSLANIFPSNPNYPDILSGQSV